MDFMVYGQSDRVSGKWNDAFYKNRNFRSVGWLEEDLATRFKEKSKATRKRHEMLDLMECCSYHCHHIMLERPCYLDK
jgi:hypothetical protein